MKFLAGRSYLCLRTWLVSAFGNVRLAGYEERILFSHGSQLLNKEHSVTVKKSTLEIFSLSTPVPCHPWMSVMFLMDLCAAIYLDFWFMFGNKNSIF